MEDFLKGFEKQAISMGAMMTAKFHRLLKSGDKEVQEAAKSWIKMQPAVMDMDAKFIHAPKAARGAILKRLANFNAQTKGKTNLSLLDISRHV